ncbi:MAG: hypothetical protein IT431_14420 [Phycisphaerales bacterium]|nr:hypothetical protein [Phycisphaerales bacterium]
MEPIRRVIAGAREYLGKMSGSQKLLMWSIAIIAAMSLFLVTQYSGRSSMAELFGEGEAASQMATVRQLKDAGIAAELVNGKVMVPSGSEVAATSVLAQAGVLPNDTTLLFNNLLDRQGFYYSKQQNEQLYQTALQNELAKVIRGFNDVRDATVMLDAPEPQGIGRAVRQPTASATVFTRSGRALGQGEVDAIAELIAGAKAGLKVEHIRVIDGSQGRQRRPTSPDQMLATTYLEQTAAQEEKLQRKLSELLGHIPGVTIAVTAQVDVTRVNKQSVKFLPNKEGSVQIARSIDSDSTSQGQASKAAEPGARPNAQGDIRGSSGGSSTTLEETRDKTEFEVGMGTETTTEQDPRGMPTMLAASVNIPRGYIVEQIRAAAAEGQEPDLSETAVQAKFAAEQAVIEASIEPHLQVAGERPGEPPIQGKVVVSMIPLDVVLPATGAGAGGMLGTLAGGGGMLGGGLIEKALLALLALGAMGMMLMMVRKATRPAELPSVEELSGVPPTLPTVNDMVGEADESEAAMTGIEVGDDEVRARKLVEQVIEMVGSNPDSAANLLGRWVTEED